MQIMRVLNEESHTCPCCGESHAVQEVVVQRRIAEPSMGFVGTVPARYFYCANADEFFEDHELAEWNAAQGPQINMGGGVPFGGIPFQFRKDEMGFGRREDEAAEAV